MPVALVADTRVADPAAGDPDPVPTLNKNWIRPNKINTLVNNYWKKSSFQRDFESWYSDRIRNPDLTQTPGSATLVGNTICPGKHESAASKVNTEQGILVCLSKLWDKVSNLCCECKLLSTALKKSNDLIWRTFIRNVWETNRCSLS